MERRRRGGTITTVSPRQTANEASVLSLGLCEYTGLKDPSGLKNWTFDIAFQTDTKTDTIKNLAK